MNRLRSYVVLVLSYAFFFSGSTLVMASGNDKLPITTKSETAKQFFIQGRDFVERVRIPEAIELFTKAINEDPDFALAYLYKAQAENSGNQFTADLNKAVSLSGNVSEAEQDLILGYQAGLNGEQDKQKEMYQKVENLFPNDERVQWLMAGYHGTEYDKAIEHLKNALSINPSFAPAYNSLGYAYMNLGKYDEAETSFRKYIDVLPGDPNPYDSYAELLLKEGKYDEALSNYHKALDIKPDFVSSKFGIAAVYMYQGKHTEACDHLREVVKDTKFNSQKENALRLMAVCYIDEGSLDEALNRLDEVNTVAASYGNYSEMANTAYRRGTILYEMGKYDAAVKEFKLSQEYFNKTTTSKEARENYGTALSYPLALIFLKQHNANIAAARSNVPVLGITEGKTDEQKEQVRFVRALSLIDQGDGKGILTELKDANQNDPYVLYLMGKAYQLNGDNESAKIYFNKVLTLNELPTIALGLARYNTQKALRELK